MKNLEGINNLFILSSYLCRHRMDRGDLNPYPEEKEEKRKKKKIKTNKGHKSHKREKKRRRRNETENIKKGFIRSARRNHRKSKGVRGRGPFRSV